MHSHDDGRQGRKEGWAEWKAENGTIDQQLMNGGDIERNRNLDAFHSPIRFFLSQEFPQYNAIGENIGLLFEVVRR